MPYDFSDSVLRAVAGPDTYAVLRPEQLVRHDNSSDLDLGSSPPALLSNGTVVQVGKNR